MKIVIVTSDQPETEFDYFSLDLYRVLDGIGTTCLSDIDSDKIREYLGNYRTTLLSNIKDSIVLLFESIDPKDMQKIDPSNKIIKFVEDGNIDYRTILSHGAINSFVCLGSRTAYKTAHNLRTMQIIKPVYKIIPWTDIDGIKTYDEQAFGKIKDINDIGIRSMLRMMAAGAIVVVPNISPFNDMIYSEWNGLIYYGEYSNLTTESIKDMKNKIKTDSVLMSNIARKFAQSILNKDKYNTTFKQIIEGNAFDHNEPWVSPITMKRTKWIIPKEDGEGGQIRRIPTSYNSSFKEMRVLTISRLLGYLVNVPFDKVYVFDVAPEDLDNDKIGNINRMITMLGDKIKDVHFCITPPEEWKLIPQLSYLSLEEGIRQAS